MIDVERLRAHVHARTDVPADPAGCAEPDEIWAAARGEREPERVRALLDHARRCPECARCFSLAAEIGGGPEATAPSGSGRTAAWTVLAAAIVAALAIPLAWVDRTSLETPRMREASGAMVDTRVPESVALPRDEAILRWTPAPEGTTYDVEIVDERLGHVYDARGLTEPRLAIPPAALDGIAPGERILWRVEAVRPDGTRIASPTFIHVVE